jgi:hypothetical protein
MSKVDDWIKPGAIVPVTNESVSILIDHIKQIRGIKEPVKTKMVIVYHKGKHQYEIFTGNTWIDRDYMDLIGYFEVVR